MKLSGAKANFFDRIEKEIGRAKAKVFARAGTIVRRQARRLLNKRAKVAYRARRKADGSVERIAYLIGAPAGQPPRKRTAFLRDNVFFAYDRARDSVVVGPILINRPTGAPEILEYGGTITVPKRRRDGSPVISASGKVESRTIRLAPRPYMWPATQSKLGELPEAWRDSIGRG